MLHYITRMLRYPNYPVFVYATCWGPVNKFTVDYRVAYQKSYFLPVRTENVWRCNDMILTSYSFEHETSVKFNNIFFVSLGAIDCPYGNWQQG